VYTEYKQDGIIFHAHLNYNASGEWYDWVMLDFAAPEDDSDYPINAEGRYFDQSSYPVKILCSCKLLMAVYMQL